MTSSVYIAWWQSVRAQKRPKKNTIPLGYSIDDLRACTSSKSLSKIFLTSLTARAGGPPDPVYLKPYSSRRSYCTLVWLVHEGKHQNGYHDRLFPTAFPYLCKVRDQFQKEYHLVWEDIYLIGLSHPVCDDIVRRGRLSQHEMYNDWSQMTDLSSFADQKDDPKTLPLWFRVVPVSKILANIVCWDVGGSWVRLSMELAPIWSSS